MLNLSQCIHRVDGKQMPDACKHTFAVLLARTSRNVTERETQLANTTASIMSRPTTSLYLRPYPVAQDPLARSFLSYVLKLLPRLEIV